MANRWGNNGNSNRLYFLGLQNHCRWWLQPWNLKMLSPWKKSYDKPRQCTKKQRHHFVDKGQNYGFSNSHAWIWELDHKEFWALKNRCAWIVVLEKTLESSWTARISNRSILKEIKPEYSLEGLMLKLNLQHLGHLMWKANSLEKTLMLGKIEGRRKRGGRGWDGWMASLTERTLEFELTLGDRGGQRSLACCSPWGLRVRHNLATQQ